MIKRRLTVKDTDKLKELFGRDWLKHLDYFDLQKEVPKGVDKSNWLEQGNDACNG